MIRHALPVLIAAIATGAQALTLAVPQGSTQTAEVTTQGATLSVPVAPLNEGFLQTEPARGTLTRRAFRVDATDLTPGQLIAPLAQQLRAAEWEVLLSCQARACGGFDFRFNLTVLPPPEMFVDLGRFEYLSARAPDGGAWVTLLASVTPQAGYVQITQVTGRGAAPGITQTATAPRPAPPNDLGRALEETGHVVLEDLQFASGSTDLGQGPFATLSALAAYLAAAPDRRVALVGHTDAAGSLDGNIALSKRRAEAVRTRLINSFGVDAAQVAAEGMGYLAPRASNLTEEGRTLNRRVEVILTSTE